MPGQKVLALGTRGDTGGPGCSWPCLGSGGGGVGTWCCTPRGAAAAPSTSWQRQQERGGRGEQTRMVKIEAAAERKVSPGESGSKESRGGERGAQGRILPSVPSSQRRRLGLGELGPIQPHSGAEPHTGSCRCQWPWWGHPESLRVHGDIVAVSPRPKNAPCCSRCPQAGSGTTLPGAIGG